MSLAIIFNDFAMRSYGDLDILIAAADLSQVVGFCPLMVTLLKLTSRNSNWLRM
jgi:hypothetical protein